MGQLPNLILAANPLQEGQITGESGRVIAHMAYRVDPEPRLMRLNQRLPGKGGLLYFSLGTQCPGGRWNCFLQQIVRECAARSYQGAVADLPQGCGSLAQQLDRLLEERKLSLYVPERYHAEAPHAKVLVSTAISGGSLRARLGEAVQRYGGDRVVAAVEKVAEDFQPPAPGGSGTALSEEALMQLRNRIRPNVYWSPELCARYFTYFESGSRPHFVLFDDPETLRAKIRLAGDVGIRTCMAAWADLHPSKGEN